jgi:hypothetical protein
MPLSVATCPEGRRGDLSNLVADRSVYNVLSQPLSLSKVDSVVFVSSYAIPAMVETAGDGAILTMSSSPC